MWFIMRRVRVRVVGAVWYFVVRMCTSFGQWTITDVGGILGELQLRCARRLDLSSMVHDGGARDV